MHTLIQKLGLVTVLSASLLGCSKPLPPATQESMRSQNKYQIELHTALTENRQLKEEATHYQTTITKLEEKIGTERATVTSLLEKNMQLQQNLTDTLMQGRTHGAMATNYMVMQKQVTDEKKRMHDETQVIQKLLAVPGYTLPGSPLVVAGVRGKKLENVTTFHFALPRVILTEEQLDLTLTHLGGLGYKPTHTEGAFSNWTHRAGIPLHTFKGYNNTPLQHDRAATLCKAYHDSLASPLPGIVLWTNQTGMHLIGSQQALDAWRARK